MGKGHLRQNAGGLGTRTGRSSLRDGRTVTSGLLLCVSLLSAILCARVRVRVRRLIRFSLCSESHTDYMVRRGIALIVNHGEAYPKSRIQFVCSYLAGFAGTPEGQKDFLYKVATIAGSVQETCDQAGIVALLRTKSEYKHHEVRSSRGNT